MAAQLHRLMVADSLKELKQDVDVIISVSEEAARSVIPGESAIAATEAGLNFAQSPSKQAGLNFLVVLILGPGILKNKLDEFGEPGGGGKNFNAPRSGLTGATRLSPEELATGQRLEQLLGKSVKESPHVGAEYVDDLGRSYDALGTPAASQYWNAKKFFKSIDGHLLKSNDFTVIDLTGFTPSQIAEVRKYLNGLSKAQLDKIIRIGF